MEGLGESPGSLLRRMYKTFLYTESVLKTSLYGLFQPHPKFGYYMVRTPGDILKDDTAHMEKFSP